MTDDNNAAAAAAVTALDALQAAASCAICYSVFDTPLLLKSCGHSFCSGCIRHSLEFQERGGPPTCPTCRKPCDARDLLPNTSLREVLDKYAAARPLLLSLAQEHQQRAAAAAARQVAVAQAASPHPAAPRRSGRKRPLQQQKQKQPASTNGRRTRAGSAADMEVEEVDLVGDSDSSGSEHNGAGSASDASLASSDSSGDDSGDWSSEASQSPRKRQRAPPVRKRGAGAGSAARQQQASAAPGAAPALDTPAGFVRCPVCSKTVPSFYINSHVDQCLAGGAAGASGPVTSQLEKADGASTSRAAQPQPAAAAPYEPLVVPAKLVPNLASEKSLRQLLKRYHLPTDGRKKDLLERYSKLRLAVEMANDRQERISYERLAKRVMQQERQKAAAHLLLPSAGRKAAAPAAVVQAEARPAAPAVQAAAAADGDGSSNGEGGDAAGIKLVGCSYKELIAVTRRRDAARRAVRQQQQEQQQQGEERQQRVEQQQQVEQQHVKQEDQRALHEVGRSISLPEAGSADGRWWHEEDEDNSSDLWSDQLPLSQAQQGEWQLHVQRHQRHRLAVEGGQQEQHPPNSQPAGCSHAATASCPAAAAAAAGQVDIAADA